MKYYKWCLVLLSICGSLYGAAFNHPSSLINVPVYKPYEMGEFEFGLGWGMYSMETNEFDVMMNFAITDQVVAGITLLNSYNAVGNLHCNFFKLDTHGQWALSGGVTNITVNPKVSDWDDFTIEKSNNYSPYIVSNWDWRWLTLHVGYGTKKFEKGYPGIDRENSMPGLIGGLTIPIKRTRLMMEFDGKDYNMGVGISVTPQSDIKIAMTEMFLNDEVNANYNNQPTRVVTFGFTYKKNVVRVNEEKVQELQEDIQAVEVVTDDLEELRTQLREELALTRQERDKIASDVAALKDAIKGDSRYIYEKDQQKKDELRRHYLEVNQDIGEQVVQLYYESFEDYYQRRFYKAVEKLQKAIVLDPYMPQLYIRLGSIYYELGLPRDALENWEKAQDLDPGNEELRSLLSKVQ